MAYRGLAVPIRAVNGRAVTVAGEAQTRKLLQLCCSDGDSSNAFADEVGLAAPIFAVDNPATRATVKGQIESHFRRLLRDDRAKLTGVDFDSSAAASGDLRIQVSYIDLETGSPQQLATSLAGV